jgi:predicted permease
MALIIAEALVPVFFVIFLGYLAGARRIIDNQHHASLNVLLLTFVLPVALFDGVAQTSRPGLEENEKLFLVVVISMLVTFGITFALNHYVFRLSPSENAVQSFSVGFPNFPAVGLPLLGSVMGPGSAVSGCYQGKRGPIVGMSFHGLKEVPPGVRPTARMASDQNPQSPPSTLRFTRRLHWHGP